VRSLFVVPVVTDVASMSARLATLYNLDADAADPADSQKLFAVLQTRSPKCPSTFKSSFGSFGYAAKRPTVVKDGWLSPAAHTTGDRNHRFSFV